MKTMDCHLFTRIGAREGLEGAVKVALKELLALARRAPGCLEVRAFAAARDPRLFLVCSRWQDAAGVEAFANLPVIVARTDRLLEMLTHQLDLVLLRALDADGEGRAEGYWGAAGPNHHVFGRHHAHPGREDALAEAMRDVVEDVRRRPGAVSASVYRSLRDPAGFLVHAEWTDEASSLATLDEPRVVAFIEYLQSLEDTPINVVRAHAAA